MKETEVGMHIRTHTRACGLSKFVKSTIMRNMKRQKNIMFYIIFMTLEFMLDLISNVYFNVN